MIEVEVHQQLRAFLREQSSGVEPLWPHHLTLARLVARALRLGRSVLLQVTPSPNSQSYRLSYLLPLLLWSDGAVLVAPESVLQRVLQVDLPRLQTWLPQPRSIQRGDRWPGESFTGLLLTTPEVWLGDRLNGLGDQSRFPASVPTLLDGVDDLEGWVAQMLRVAIAPGDWEALRLARPADGEAIRDTQVQVAHHCFAHPTNPYDCYGVDPQIQEQLDQLLVRLGPNLPEPWASFWRLGQRGDQLTWAEVDRRLGQFRLYRRPLNLAEFLTPLWSHQPLVLLGEALDPEADAPHYREQFGLGEITSLKFAPDRQSAAIQLYLPDHLPLPNTAHFQMALLVELRRLLTLSATVPGLAVLLVNDLPLKPQMASALAAEFGSRVQVEQTCLEDNGILVCGWQFWLTHQSVLPAPRLLVMATLPFPSLEDPLVAGRVEYYKRQHQDWFRSYLLPNCLRDLQRAIAPVRDGQSLVALLDVRVLHRSYGQQILAALSPAARVTYLDPSLFEAMESA